MITKTFILFNKKPLTLLGLFYCILSSSFAQNKITTTQFLENGNTINQQKSDSLITALNGYHYKTSIIKGVQIRTETKNLQLNKQEYSLRVKPNNFSTNKNQKKVFLNKIEKVKLENEIIFNTDLENRYFTILDVVFTNELIVLLNKKQAQLKDKLIILGEHIYDTNFDVKDLVETEEDLQSTALKLINLKEVKINSQNLIKYYSNSTKVVTFDLTNFIQPQQIIDFSNNEVVLDKSTKVSLQQIKLDLLESQMQLETSKSKQVIDYVQTKYGGRNSFLFNENFSVGIGINLPFFGNNKQKKGTYYFDKLNTEHKYALLKKEILYNNNIKTSAFKNAKINYQTIVKQKEESSISALLSTYQKMEGVSPLILLKLEILIQKKEIEIVKAKHQLYKSYITVLVGNGFLFQKPFRNYLMVGL